jgi:hypothetical protein
MEVPDYEIKLKYTSNGLDETEALIPMLVEAGAIKQGGAWYSRNDPLLGDLKWNGGEKFLEWVNEEPGRSMLIKDWATRENT